MTDAKTTVTVSPDRRSEPRPAPLLDAHTEDAEGDEAPRDWFAAAVPGARPGFRRGPQIGMG